MQVNMLEATTLCRYEAKPVQKSTVEPCQTKRQKELQPVQKQPRKLAAVAPQLSDIGKRPASRMCT